MAVAEHENDQPAAFPDFSDYSKRVESFRGWPASRQQTPLQLANAGFYYKGSGDRVQCFHCGRELGEWDARDDPWAEHERLTPNCNLVKSRFGNQQGACATVEAFADVLDSRNTHSVPADLKEGKDSGNGPSLSASLPESGHSTVHVDHISCRQSTKVTTPSPIEIETPLRRSTQTTDLWTPSDGNTHLLKSPSLTIIDHQTLLATRGQTAVSGSSTNEPPAEKLTTATVENRELAPDPPNMSVESQREDLTSLPSLSTSITFGITNDLIALENNEDASAKKPASDGPSILTERQPTSTVVNEEGGRRPAARPTPNIEKCLQFGRDGIQEIKRMSGRWSNPHYPEYDHLCPRMSSFSRWRGRTSANRLALAGFFFTGFADCVRCFHCGCTLQFWEYNDDPFTEHLLTSPCCRYIRRYMEIN